MLNATVVVDNIGNNELKGEWGLCIYIEYNEKSILLDVGASPLFAENADKLKLPWINADYAILSHAHYDHANGMNTFFRQNSKAKFFVRKSCDENCYFKKWIIHKYIGIPKGILQEQQNRIIHVDGDYKIDEGIYLIPHKTSGLELIGKQEMMYVREHRKWRPDDFSHEQSLVFDIPEGLVVFNSCSHGGADNIIKEISNTFPEKRVLALIGGFHLYNKSEQYVRQFADRVKKTGIKYIYTGHCTGNKSFQILHDELGENVKQFKVGMTMSF